MNNNPILLFISTLLMLLLIIADNTISYIGYKNLSKRIDDVEVRIDKINNECVHMREVDTLILNMSEINSKNIEVVEENNSVLFEKIARVEKDIDELYIYD